MSQIDTRKCNERCTGREGGRKGDIVIGTVTREPGAGGTQLSPKEYGENGDVLGRW